jgi:hypothetical protein
LVTRGSGAAAVDLGAGRFETGFRAGDLLVVAPGAGSSIRREADHELIGLDVN